MASKTVKKTKKKPAAILIVDDHPIVRYGVSRIITKTSGMTVCGEAENANQTIQFLEHNKPDAIILDISLDGAIDGLKLTKMIRAKYPKLPILILSMHDESCYAQKAITSGASGYIMKGEPSERLVRAIRTVLKGDIYLGSNIRESMLFSLSSPKDHNENVMTTLSDRERQVFHMIGNGTTTRSIANKLCVSMKTIETHRTRIKKKLGISTANELVMTAATWSKRDSAPQH